MASINLSNLAAYARLRRRRRGGLKVRGGISTPRVPTAGAANLVLVGRPSIVSSHVVRTGRVGRVPTPAIVRGRRPKAALVIFIVRHFRGLSAL